MGQEKGREFTVERFVCIDAERGRKRTERDSETGQE